MLLLIAVGKFLVSRQYFSTIGQRIVSGRDFAESDSSASRPVAILNEAFVRKYFPNEDPMDGLCPFVFCEKLLGYFCDDDLLSFLWAVY